CTNRNAIRDCREENMKRNLSATIAAITLLAALAMPVRLAAQRHIRYRVVDVGTLGGPNSSLPGSFFEVIAAESLSRAGTFAGQADTATPDPFAPNCFGDCLDRKSTRLNSSHVAISYAVFC